MSSLHPFLLSPPPRPERTVELVDGDRPDLRLKVRLRALDLVSTMAAQDLADDLLSRCGDGFPPVGGETFDVGRTLADAAAGLAMMQREDGDSRRLAVEEWVALAKASPDMFGQALAAARDLNRRAKRGKAGTQRGKEAARRGTSPASR